MVQELQVDRVVELDGQGWAALIDEGEMTQELLAKELADYVEAKIDVVVLANTHFWDIKEELQQILGWQVYIIDQREELLYELCNALELRGIDGRRRK